MAELVIVSAPEPRFDVVRGVLQDWVAAGLIGSFLWSHTSDPAAPLLRCGSGGAQSVRIDQLAARERIDSMVLVDLTGVGRDLEQGRSFAEAVRAAFPAAATVQTRAVFAGAAEVETTNRLATPGWHTVVLAPEDGAAPDRVGALVDGVADAPEVVAAALCGLAGLWREQSGSPLRDEAAAVFAGFRMLRAYHRSLDGTEVQRRLRRALLHMDARLPVPTQAGVPAMVIENTALAGQDLARAFWDRHQDVLRGPRETAPQSTAKPIGALAALRMFFGFLGGAFRNAPRRWLDRTLDSVRVRTAAAVQEGLFGRGESAMAVVVGGLTADGRPASWLEQRQAAERLVVVLESVGGEEHYAPFDGARLWQDYVDGALTLADAGERVAGMPPVLVNGRRGVVTAPGSIVPGPADRFTSASPALVAAIGPVEVDAFDLLGAKHVDDVLHAAEEDQAIARAASDSRNSLKEWAQANRGTFATRIGGAIASSYTAVGAEAAEIAARLRTAASTEEDGDRLGRRQRALARALRIIAAVFVVVVAVLVLLAVLAVLGVLAAVAWGVGALVAWFLTSLIAFVRGQTELFRIMNERARQASNQTVDEHNLRYALRDIQRLGDMYAQFLLWSRAISAMLAKPFGDEPDEARTDTEVTGLPRGVMIGALVPSEEAVGRVATDLRRELFAAGWLTPVWDGVIGSAGTLLGARAGELDERPGALFSDSGDPDGLLATWVDALLTAGPARDGGDEYWSRALEALDSAGHQDARDRLRGAVRASDGTTGPLVEFEGGVADWDPDQESRFTEVLLTPAGRIADRRLVERSRLDGGDHGLGGAWTLVQLSNVVPENEFIRYEMDPPPDDDGPERDGPGPVEPAFGPF